MSIKNILNKPSINIPAFFRSGYLLVVFSILLIASGCSQPGKITANLGQEVSIAVGQTVSLNGNDDSLKIKFAEVVSDSRCATGVECVWQGEVSCRLEVTYRNVTNTKIITQPGLTTDPTSAEFNGYNLKFQVQPYPEAGKEIKNSEYRLQLTVDKKPSLSGGILVTFDVVGEQYHIFITNPQTIEDVFAVQQGKSQATIPNGLLVRGNVSYNTPWSWYIDSEDIHMAEMTIELSDGTPSQVENNLDYWLNTVKRFSPWSARIVNIEDFR